jgi:hypothetical protein
VQVGVLEPPQEDRPERALSSTGGVLKTPLKALGVIGLGFATVVLAIPDWEHLPELNFVAPVVCVLGTFVLARRWGLAEDVRFLRLWVGTSLAFAIVSTLTGLFNNITDEPLSMPTFVHLWPNLYSGATSLTVVQHGVLVTRTWEFVYLPFLPFYQIPGVNYEYLMIGTWVATLYLVRKNRVGLILLASPWVGVIAANGFNDFVPLLFLTLTFVTLHGYKSRLAEVVSLGLKQFANVLVVAYYVLTRRWWRALEATLVSVAIVLPFALMDPPGFWCNVIAGCAPDLSSRLQFSSPTNGLLSHANYGVWPLYVLGIFGPRYGLARFRSVLARLLPSRQGTPP